MYLNSTEDIMRMLTLDERITIKGILAKKGVPVKFLAGKFTRTYIATWYRVMPGPMANYYKWIK